MSKPETLQKKYVGKVSRRALHFMKNLLQMEPSERPSSLQCLSSLYFEGLVAPSVPGGPGQSMPTNTHAQVRKIVVIMMMIFY